MRFVGEKSVAADNARARFTEISPSALCKLSVFPPRFRAKVKIDNSGCWLWTGHTVFPPKYPQHKYGQYYLRSLGHGRGFFVKAHRFSYAFAKGPIPKGLEIDHICNVKLCVNPAHLRAVTHKENVQTRSQHGPKKGALCRPR